MNNKEQLLEELRTARSNLLDAIDGLTPEQMRMPGACGIWAVKDVLAHLTAWESELVTGIHQAHRKHPPQIAVIEDFYEWNDEQYHLSASRPLEAVMEDFTSVHTILIRTISELDGRTLFDRRVYEWMEGEPLAYLIQETASWHENEHADDIRQWRMENGF